MRFFETPAVRVLLALFALPLAACATGGGTFGPDGFHHGEFPIAVHYTDPAAKQFLGPEWRVDNFNVEADGSIGSPKSTDAYQGREAVDLKGDGQLTHTHTYFFDLKLDNRKTSAVIWVQSIHLGHNDGDRNLRTLVEQYAEAISGAGFFAAVSDGRVVKVKTYAAKIVEGKDTTLGSLPAYDARLELANLDQVRLDPSTRTAIIRVVLVKTDYFHNWEEDFQHRFDSRTLVRVGYRASPSDFDAGLPDFERFLTLLEFGPPKPAKTAPLY